MVYVPLDVDNPAKDVPYQIKQEAGLRFKTSADWSVTTSNPSGSIRIMRGSRVTGSGPRISNSWGFWWYPSGYSRVARLVTLTGGSEMSCNSSSLATATRYLKGTGNRPIRSPSGPALNLGSEDTGLNADALPILDANTKARLVTECILKIGNRKVNYGEMLGESISTMNHLARSVIRLCRFILAIRKGRGLGHAFAEIGVTRQSVRRGKTPAELWLEGIYGWLPLINDIYDTYGHLTQGLNKRPLLLSAVRQISLTYVAGRNALPYVTLTGSATNRHRCKLWYRLVDRTSDDFYQMGLIDPKEVAWALTPFSFVIDWLAPVGNVLEAYSALKGLTFVAGCFSSRRDATIAGPHVAAARSGETILHCDYYWRVDETGFVRQRIVTSPQPTLYVKSPFSTTHVITALALIRTLRK